MKLPGEMLFPFISLFRANSGSPGNPGTPFIPVFPEFLWEIVQEDSFHLAPEK